VDWNAVVAASEIKARNEEPAAYTLTAGPAGCENRRFRVARAAEWILWRRRWAEVQALGMQHLQSDIRLWWITPHI